MGHTGVTLLGNNIHIPSKALSKMIFLLQRWDMLVSWEGKTFLESSFAMEAMLQVSACLKLGLGTGSLPYRFEQLKFNIDFF